MKVAVRGIGLWSRGLAGMADFAAARQDGFAALAGATFAAPRPAAIPARERRRAGLAINLAVEVAHQACEAAQVDKATIPSVFASALGDSATMDYMCRKLAGRDKLLSPTKFHNSVHNAPSGYWTISTGNRAPSTFISCFLHSFAAGLLEAASQAVAADGAVLLVASDIAATDPLNDLAAITETFGAAFVIEPAGAAPGAEVRFVAEPAEPPVPRTAALAALAEGNPVGCALALIEQCVASDSAAAASLRFPAAPCGAVEWRPCA